MDIYTLTRKELEKIRDEDLALSPEQNAVFTAKYIHKIKSIDDICRRLNISRDTYYRELRPVKMMITRLFEQEIEQDKARGCGDND